MTICVEVDPLFGTQDYGNRFVFVIVIIVGFIPFAIWPAVLVLVVAPPVEKTTC